MTVAPASKGDQRKAQGTERGKPEAVCVSTNAAVQLKALHGSLAIYQEGTAQCHIQPRTLPQRGTGQLVDRQLREGACCRG